MSPAYSQAILVENFLEAVQSSALKHAETQILQVLFRLFALYTIDAEAREFQSSGAISPETLDALPDRVLDLMQQVRPHAVRLVDAFALPDFLLDRYVLLLLSDRREQKGTADFATARWAGTTAACTKISSTGRTSSIR